MLIIISSVAVLEPNGCRSIKNSGIPTRAPLPKQMICRLVRLKKTLLLTFDRSLGTGTYGILIVTENLFQRVL